MRKAILVGAGGMGQAWARNLTSAGVKIAAWVDVRPNAAREAAERLELSIPVLDSSLEEALKGVVADFVVDVTIPEAHPRVTIAALEAGFAVLGEKPMAPSLDEGRAMIAAAERANRLYMVSQSRRYDANISSLRELAQRVGGLEILNADFYRGPHFGGFRDEMASPLLLDMAIHTFDQARFITGADPVSVYAEEFNPSWSWYAGDASAQACFEMSGGLRFNYRGSWCSRGGDTSWQAEWRGYGPNGAVKWDGETLPTAELAEGDNVNAITGNQHDVPGGIAGSLREFLGALDSGVVPNGECHDNIKSLAMVLAAVESATKGVRVKVEW